VATRIRRARRHRRPGPSAGEGAVERVEQTRCSGTDAGAQDSRPRPSRTSTPRPGAP
jgi:hypothetical protein